VIVELNAINPSIPSIRSAFARRPSALWSSFAPLLFDEPFKGMNEWKKQVAQIVKTQD